MYIRQTIHIYLHAIYEPYRLYCKCIERVVALMKKLTWLQNSAVILKYPAECTSEEVTAQIEHLEVRRWKHSLNDSHWLQHFISSDPAIISILLLFFF